MKAIRVYLCSCVGFFVLAGLGIAQAPSENDKAIPLSKVERKRKAPVSSDVLRPKLPKPVELKLDNGLTVLVLEDHKLPTVAMRLTILGAGGLNDPPNMPGLASFTAAMLKEGTKSRSSKQIAEDIDRLGASVFAATTYNSDSVTISASGLSDNMGQWLGLAADIL